MKSNRGDFYASIVFFIFSLIIAALVFSGCGYHLAQKPKTYDCVSITQMQCDGNVCQEKIQKHCTEAQ